jgi:uncharacterized protein YjiK
VNSVCRQSALVFLLLIGAACTKQEPVANSLDQTPSVDVPGVKWKLPSQLREISGLALTPDGRLFGVDDEQAVIYQIDFTTGQLVKAFAVGKPVLRGDFEGIAYLNESLFLVTSNGVIFKVREGANGDRVAHEKIRTGLGKQCEIEGLAQDPVAGYLLLVCKKVRKKADISTLSVFIWRPGEDHVDPDERIELPVTEILASLGTDDFNPSGIVVDPSTGSIFIVAARQHAVVSIDRQGGFVGAMLLSPAKWHRQAEGIEMSMAAQLIIADEGGKSRARLTVYDKFHDYMSDNNE